MLGRSLAPLAAVVATLLASSAEAASVCYQHPISPPKITSAFGDTEGRPNPHRGTDYGAGTGTPIGAVADGVVVEKTWSGCQGNVVVLSHADGMFSSYSHMNKASPLAVGQAVSRGGVVGVVGATGTCQTGAHLHLTISDHQSGYYAGQNVDPYQYIESHKTCGCQGDECDQLYVDGLTSSYAPPATTDVDGDGRADLCARSSDGVHCWFGTESGGFDPGTGKVLVPLSNANGWTDPSNYATLRFGDLDGDGRADLCARANDRMLCWTSATNPLGTRFDGPAWSDAAGWGAARYYSTIRFADIDGDGRADLCARSSAGIRCHLSTGTGFGPPIAGPAWSDATGFGAAKYYATLRVGDVTGDGKDDICIRSANGIRCAPSTGDGFGTPFAGPDWSDAKGWNKLMYWSSIRLADVDGDGRADVCARHSQGLVCHLSTGSGFGPELQVADLRDSNGWTDPGNYSTLRTGDIDGDGAADLCIRANTSVLCYRHDNGAFVTVQGPAWSDESGWNVPQHFETLRVADVDGDHKADVCARSSEGMLCARSNGTDFGSATKTSILSNAAGWAKQPYFGSIFLGTPVCRAVAEVCNGRDDDCDGQVDEGDVCASSPGGAGGAGASAAGAAGATVGGGGADDVPQGSGGIGQGDVAEEGDDASDAVDTGDGLRAPRAEAPYVSVDDGGCTVAREVGRASTRACLRGEKVTRWSSAAGLLSLGIVLARARRRARAARG